MRPRVPRDCRPVVGDPGRGTGAITEGPEPWRREGALARGPEARRFLISLLVTSRYHLTSRPMSYSNADWFRRLARQCDRLLAHLREEGWAALEPPVEAGLAGLDPMNDGIETWLVDPEARRAARRAWRVQYHTCFAGLSQPWSRLAPDEALTLARWPTPRRILVTVGPNIGIGDQLILFPLVQALRARFPAALIESLSSHASLWELCPAVDRAVQAADDLLAIPVAARDLLAQERDALVVFTEFASAPFYRNLEVVPGFDRFVYVDSGARCGRLVDQRRGAVRELEGDPEQSIFEFCGAARHWLGLAAAGEPYGAAAAARWRPLRAPRVVYLNPFSSKDHARISPLWWSRVLAEAAAGGPIAATIFAGTNEECRRFARAIAAGLGGSGCTAALHGERAVPSVGETITAAMHSDAVLGLDTFTGHLPMLCATRAVVVFFDGRGGSWDGWRSPHAGVLDACVTDEPEAVGRLLRRLLFPPPPEVRRAAGRLHRLTRWLERQIGAPRRPPVRVDDLLVRIDALRRALAAWGRADPALAATFADAPPVLGESLERVLRGMSPATRLDEPLRRHLLVPLRLWRQSNLCRYARLCAAASGFAAQGPAAGSVRDG
jgi:ADP-heptose:LPS heptosyltransferase